jgi:hypothetical protein
MGRDERSTLPGWREFQIQRTLVLGLFGPNSKHFDEAYIFAWANGVYPCFTDSQLHLGFDEFFHPTKEMMDELAEVLDKAFLAQTPPPTVYDLEHSLGVRHTSKPWSRSDLINALRYMALNDDRFSPQFWQSMTRNAGAPSEANSFFLPFREWDDSPH